MIFGVFENILEAINSLIAEFNFKNASTGWVGKIKQWRINS